MLLSHFFAPTERAPVATQAFYKEAVMWGRLNHPNIIPFIGVTRKPMQFVSEWMPNGTLPDYINENPEADRVGLVSSSSL